MDDQELASMRASYNDEEAPTTTPEPEIVEQPPAKMAQITEEQYQELLSKTTAIDQIKAENKKQFDALFGHVGGFKQALSQMQAASQKVADAPTNDQMKAAIANPEKWSQLTKDHPEWAQAHEELIDSKLANMQSMKPDQIEQLISQRIEGQTQAMQKQIIHSSLNAVFPGWIDTVNSPEFNAWKEANADIQDSDDIGDIVRILRRYEQSTEAPQKSRVQRENRIAAAVTPRGSGATVKASSEQTEIEAMRAAYGG